MNRLKTNLSFRRFVPFTFRFFTCRVCMARGAMLLFMIQFQKKMRWRSKNVALEIRSWYRWLTNHYPVPVPSNVKKAVLQRYQVTGGVWVETGTYLGHTTRFLSKIGSEVYTIEPSPIYAPQAKQFLKNYRNIRVIEGSSENQLDSIIDVVGRSVNFWLDGHFSGALTFKNSMDTPIRTELSLISKHKDKFDELAVFVDDVRCFGSQQMEYQDYPSKDFLVHWAQDMNLDWSIEYDIFVARSRVREPKDD